MSKANQIEEPVEMIKIRKSKDRYSSLISPVENDEESSDDISDESENETSTSDTLGVWLLGLSCHFGYNVLLSAAHDLIENRLSVQLQLNYTKHDYRHENVTTKHHNKYLRECNEESTGHFLLINVIPELIAQILSTFIPFFCIHFRIFVIIFLHVLGLIIAASSKTPFFLYVGVGFNSFSTGLAENTFLRFISARDNKYLIIILFSGTGSAALLGSLFYVALAYVGLTYSTILYMLVSMPLLMTFAFYGLLNAPRIVCFRRRKERHTLTRVQASFEEIIELRKSEGFHSYLLFVKHQMYLNINYIPNLYPFVFAAFVVYFFEFYINQCLHELIYFKDFFLTHNEQYRWYQVTYNVAVFLVKSSLYFVSVKSLWCFPLLQGINASFLTLAAIYFLLPHFMFALCFIFWEGIMGAYMYTTIFVILYNQVEYARRSFSLGFVSIADTAGVACAALISLPAHNRICSLPEDLSIWKN